MGLPSSPASSPHACPSGGKGGCVCELRTFCVRSTCRFEASFSSTCQGVDTHTYTHTYTHTHTNTNTHTLMHTHTHTHTHTCIGTDKTGSRTDTDDGTGAKEDRRTNPNVGNDSLHSTLLIPNSSPLNLNPHTPRPKPTTPQTPHPKPAEPRVGKLRVVNRR